MDVTLKTTSFGGYDKKAVENYIDELTAEHEKEVADLKANVLKLSDRKSTRLNSSHRSQSRMPSSA